MEGSAQFLTPTWRAATARALIFDFQSPQHAGMLKDMWHWGFKNLLFYNKYIC